MTFACQAHRKTCHGRLEGQDNRRLRIDLPDPVIDFLMNTPRELDRCGIDVTICIFFL